MWPTIRIVSVGIMFRLGINQNSFTLSWDDEKKSTQNPALLITKETDNKCPSGTKATRTKLCEEGPIPASSIYKQTQKVILESKDIDKIKVERIDENQQNNPYPNKWCFKLSLGENSHVFALQHPILAYEYYFHQVKMDVLQGQLR